MKYNSYYLCSCENRSTEPYRIYKYMYVRPCHCSGDKRYLAYLAEHFSLDPGLYYDTNFFKVLKTKQLRPFSNSCWTMDQLT